jgi:competence protein ComEC
MMIYHIQINIKMKKKILNKIINYLLNTLLLTFLIQLLVLPFVISINPDFNLISIIINPIFIIFVTYLYLPISFIILIIPSILPIFSYITNIFEYLVQKTANIEFLLLSLGNIHVVFKVLYYVVFYLLLIAFETKKLKLCLFFILFMFCWYYKGCFKLNDELYFLDLHEGESTVIVSKHTKDVIVIDTGEVSKNFDFTKIIKNLGIKEIDYLIISHSDSDHIGGAINLVKYVKVKNLVLSYYDKTSSTNYLKKYSKNVYYLRSGNQITTKYFKLNVISPNKDYKNINDNSLVFTLEINNIKFLFTGDISTKVEKDIIKNNKINVDFLKIAHHGSKTSTCNEFLNNINFKYAVVMSGYYNPFGFPIKEVMNRIPKYKQLRTDEVQTIKVILKKNKYIIKN